MATPDKPESEEELEARLRRLLGDESEAPEESPLDRKAQELVEHPLEQTEHHHDELSRIEAEFKDRITGLDSRLVDAQASRKKNEIAEKQTVVGNDAQGLGVGLSIAYAILGIPILFGLIGIGVDKAFHTTFAGAFTVGGVVLAIVYVFFALNRQNRQGS